MTGPARLRRFLRLLFAPGSMVWRLPVRVRWPVDARNVRHAWRRSDPAFVDRLFERFRALDVLASERRPLSPPGVWHAYRGRVTARTGGRGIWLDGAGEHGTDLEDWLLAILGIDAYAGGRTRARLVAEVTEPRDRPDPSVGQERLRLLGVHPEQRPPDGGPADLLVRALAAYAIPGAAHPQTAVVWAITADPALDGLSPVVALLERWQWHRRRHVVWQRTTAVACCRFPQAEPRERAPSLLHSPKAAAYAA